MIPGTKSWNITKRRYPSEGGCCIWEKVEKHESNPLGFKPTNHLSLFLHQNFHLDRSESWRLKGVFSSWLLHQIFDRNDSPENDAFLKKEMTKISVSKNVEGFSISKPKGCFMEECFVLDILLGVARWFSMLGGLVLDPWDSGNRWWISQPGSSGVGDPDVLLLYPYPQTHKSFLDGCPCCVKWLMCFFDNKPNEDLWSTACCFILNWFIKTNPICEIFWSQFSTIDMTNSTYGFPPRWCCERGKKPLRHTWTRCGNSLRRPSVNYPANPKTIWSYEFIWNQQNLVKPFF